MKKPNFFIVGAPKCGTSFWHYYLSLHPDIFMSPDKEPNFFDTDLHYISQRYSLQQYENLYREVKNEKIVGEASTYYLFSSTAAKEIQGYNPSSKILISIRNPIDFMYSMHSENVYQGNEIEEDFEKALNLEEERKKGINVYPNSNPAEVVYYKSLASFSDQIKRYFDVFGRENVKVVWLEDVKKDAEEVYKCVLRFLNVDPDIEVTFNVVNENKEVKNKAVREFVRRPPNILKSIIKLIIPFENIRRSIQKGIFNLNSKKVKRKPLESDLVKRLEEEMKDEVEKLNKLVGKNK
jgi:hypothetical protein